MTKINNIQILDDIELENIVGGSLTKKKVVKKKVVKKKSASSLAMSGGGSALAMPESAI